ncbi:hypothetical protein [Streptomyces carpinensis]|uniref:Uncharacterized protein n=1 Tax=Streptomyces carpinensis TaxID=66369 RepID=A0ABV1WDF0_9ACTN|nr:hypothetical protein [Streptomyces carpinensis]
MGADDDLASQWGVSGSEESPKGPGVARGDSGEDRLAGGEQGERVTQKGAALPGLTAARAVEFDADLTPAGQAVGQCDKAAFVSVDTDVGTQSPSVPNPRMVIGITTFRQAAGGRRATRDEYRVEAADPSVATREVPQEVRSQ